MMTQSHVLMTAFLGHRLRRAGVEVVVPALMLGSFLPDVPLGLLTLWYVMGPLGGRVDGPDALFGAAYDRYFFEEPVWIAAHNTLHAPLLLAGVAALGAWWARGGRRVGRFLLWFAAAALLHTAIDVVTHVHDGPLVFFPFDWSYRIEAPVSYWDPRYGGAVFARFEAALDVAIVVYLSIVWWTARRRRGGEEGGVAVGGGV